MTAKVTTIASTERCHVATEAVPPSGFRVSNTNNKAQNDVVNPAIAKCECATKPWVNFKWSNTPG